MMMIEKSRRPRRREPERSGRHAALQAPTKRPRAANIRILEVVFLFCAANPLSLLNFDPARWQKVRLQKKAEDRKKNAPARVFFEGQSACSIFGLNPLLPLTPSLSFPPSSQSSSLEPAGCRGLRAPDVDASERTSSSGGSPSMSEFSLPFSFLACRPFLLPLPPSFPLDNKQHMDLTNILPC